MVEMSSLRARDEARFHFRGGLITHEVDVRGGDVSQARLREVIAELDTFRQRGTADSYRNRGKSVRGKGQKRTGPLVLHGTSLLITLDHVVLSLIHI